MEASTTQRRLALEDKIPDIEQTLEMVQLLKQQRDQPDSMKTTFELNDTLFAHATLEPIETVNLWLGVRCPPPLSLFLSRSLYPFPILLVMEAGKEDTTEFTGNRG